MKFRRAYRVKAPIQRVVQFHILPEGMRALTPPPVFVQIHSAPPRVQTGKEMAFTLWFGPFPVRWQARFEQVSATGFTDRQLRGPYREWVHRHSFVAIDAQTTQIREDVEGKLRRHPLWGPVGLLMWLSLPVLFAYRGWKMRSLLENRVDQGKSPDGA